MAYPHVTTQQYPNTCTQTDTHLIVSKLEQCVHGVSSGGQHKDEGSTAVRVSKCFGEVEWWGLNVLLTSFGHYKVLNSRNNLKRSAFNSNMNVLLTQKILCTYKYSTIVYQCV